MYCSQSSISSPRTCASRRGLSFSGSSGASAFTLVEVLVVMGLIGLLMVAAMGALFSMDLCTRRTADYNAALAVVEAKVEDIRAATYNPPTGTNFNSTTVCRTNSSSIALDKAGVTFQVPGTIVYTIQPITSGHLVTVTGTFQEPRQVLTVSLQTVVNIYSGGQQ
jgi:prepilin-type N-terminal cleavage/methylation domain-containing protein